MNGPLRDVVLATLLALAFSEPLHGAQCPPGEEPVPVSLQELWNATRTLEPGYRAAESTIAAGQAARSSVRREWAPSVSVEALGDHGQRLSPGEERVLGVGPRGDLRVVGSWTFLDAGRGARAREAELREAGARAGADLFDTTWRARAGTAWVEAAVAEATWAIRSVERAEVEALEAPVRARLEAGVDVAWEEHLLDEALARTTRLLADATLARDVARAELSALAGRCVVPQQLAPRPGATLSAEGVPPEVRQLQLLADERESAARALAGQDRLQLQLTGITGPTRSRAFEDGPVRSEYLVGITGSWRPDLAGVGRQLASAEVAGSRAIRAQAESRSMELDREVERLQLVLEHADPRREGLRRESEQAARRLSGALQRWEAGVDRWTEVIQASDRVHQAQLLELELEREVALTLLRLGELTGRMDELPGILGQEGADR